jgi:hypothetical protein
MREANDKLYNAPHIGRSCITDLASLPMVDDNGNEIEVFGPYRMKIGRCSGFHGSKSQCGSLLNMATVTALFDHDSHNASDYEADEDLAVTPKTLKGVQLFPLAFSGLGHVQAHCVKDCSRVQSSGCATNEE